MVTADLRNACARMEVWSSLSKNGDDDSTDLENIIRYSFTHVVVPAPHGILAWGDTIPDHDTFFFCVTFSGGMQLQSPLTLC